MSKGAFTVTLRWCASDQTLEMNAPPQNVTIKALSDLLHASASSTNQVARSEITEQYSRVSGLVIGSLNALIYLVLLQYALKNNTKLY